jgi:hypothetical protein
MVYVWYKSKQQVDQTIEQLAVFARVKYSTLFVSPFGAISINGIRITPHDSYSDFTIETLRLQAPDLWALINLEDDLRQGNIPESLQLSAEQLSIPIYALPLSSTAAPEQPEAVAFAALGCGPISDFGTDEYVAMGYETFVIDQALNYRYDKSSSNLVFHSLSSVHDSADISVELVLSVPSEQSPDSAIGPFPVPKLVSGQFAYTDQSFNKRRNDFCAGQSGGPVADYIENHIALAMQFLAAANILPSEGLVSVYRDFITTDSGSIDLQFAPAEAVDFTRLAMYPPQQLLSLLQPSLTVNGRAADDISLSFNPNITSQEAGDSASASPETNPAETFANNSEDDQEDNPEDNPAPGADDHPAPIPAYEPASNLNELSTVATPAAPVDTVAAVTTPTQQNPPAALSRVISWNEIPDYMGRNATIKMAAGKQYDGQLIDAHNTALQLKVKLRGGEVGYWLNYSDISEIQIHD